MNTITTVALFVLIVPASSLFVRYLVVFVQQSVAFLPLILLDLGSRAESPIKYKVAHEG